MSAREGLVQLGGIIVLLIGFAFLCFGGFFLSIAEERGMPDEMRVTAFVQIFFGLVFSAIGVAACVQASRKKNLP